MKITRKQLRQIIAEATQISAMGRYEEQSMHLAMVAQGLVSGAETIFGIDLDEAEEYEYGQDFREILENNPEVLELLGKIYMAIRLGERKEETSAPPLTRDELLDIATQRLGMFSSGELMEQDFEYVKQELLDDGIDPDLVNQLTYEKVLQRISDVENAGMR